MAWNPAIELSREMSGESRFWLPLQSIFDEAISPESLPRRDWEYLAAHYIYERRGSSVQQAAIGKKALQSEFADLPGGSAEVDFIDFLMNYQKNRVLALIAPRGVGKTSFLHYTEAYLHTKPLERRPIFLIIGVLPLIDESGATINAFNKDLFSLIAAEVQTHAASLEGRLRLALGNLADSVGRCSTAAEVRECFRTLTKELDRQELRRLVLVFDNLDQLHSRLGAAVVDLARGIYLVSGLACVVCLRPNCFLGTAIGGEARAFFQYRIDLRPPSVAKWLECVGSRLRVQAHAKAAATEGILLFDKRIVTPDQLGEAFDRFTHHLITYSDQDGVLPLLQAISAEDLRHLRSLTRRMVAHRGFPLEDLLSNKDRLEYRPLPVLLDGQQLLFHEAEQGEMVPNLLYWPQAQSDSRHLIRHRLLRFLATGPETIESIVDHMQVFGYERKFVMKAAQSLYGPLLIRGTNKDRFTSQDWPAALYLTEGGQYYLNHLLSNADYLLAAALDVPLRHEHMRRSYQNYGHDLLKSRMFLERFDSLVECAKEIAEKEASQITGLTVAPPSAKLRRAVDSLRHGGTLLHSIIRGLDAITERSYYSKSAFVRSGIESYERRLLDLKNSDSRTATRLLEVSRRRPGHYVREVPEVQAQGPFRFKVVDQGDCLSAQAQVGLPGSQQDALLILDVRADGSRTLRGAVTNAVDLQGNLSDSTANVVSAHFSPYASSPGEMMTVKVHAYVHQPGVKEAFLMAEVSGDATRLKLVQMGTREPPIELSHELKLAYIKSEVDKAIADISGKCTAGTLTAEHIHVVGTRLTNNLLSSQGQNVIATVMKFLERIVILAADADLSIPFEWLRPAPMGTDPELLHSLAEHCSVCRFPLTPMQYVTEAAGRTLDEVSICTVGLSCDARQPWRVPTPGSYTQLRKLCLQHKLLHIVAHLDENNALQIAGDKGTLDLSEDHLVAFPLCTPDHSIILSVCGLGSKGKNGNAAHLLAARFGSVVWTPLAAITDRIADRLDVALHSFLGQPGKQHTLDQFFRGSLQKENAQEREAFYHVYVRYGV